MLRPEPPFRAGIERKMPSKITFLAAISAQKTFTGDSSKRTWLTGILNHNGGRSNETHLPSPARSFPRTTRTRRTKPPKSPFFPSPVNAWSRDPRGELEQKELFHAFQECLKRLPERLATVFSAYETEDQSGPEICAALNISENNLWTILHRARKHCAPILSTSWIMNG